MAIPSVRAAITNSTTPLSGVFSHDTVSLVVGDDVGVFRDPATADSGIYKVAAGAWTRHPDYNVSASFPPDGMKFYVREGDLNGRKDFQFKNEVTPNLGTTPLTFWPTGFERALQAAADSGIVIDPANALIGRSATGVTPGLYPNPTINVNEKGDVTTAESGGLFSSFIEGLKVVWNSTTSFTVEAGAAHIPELGGILEMADDVQMVNLTFAANQQYYVYLFNDAGTANLDLDTIPPDLPYRADARTKGASLVPALEADDGMRYLFHIRTDSAATPKPLRWKHVGDWVYYLEDSAVNPLRVLNDGRQSGVTTISVASLVPPGCRAIKVRGKNDSTSFTAYLGSSEANGSQILPFPDSRTFTAEIPLNENREFIYRYSGGTPGAGNGFNVDLLAYREAR